MANPVHEFLVDWNDDFGFDHELSDISHYVTSCSYDYGLGVTSSPDEFSPRLLNGQLSFYDDWDRADINTLIGDGKLFQPHRFQHIVDGRVSVDCLMDVVDGRRARLLSHNTNAFQSRVQLSYASSVADSKLFHDALAQVGVAQAASSFPHSLMAAPLIIDMNFQAFLQKFSWMVGGYVVEGFDGRISFHAPLANDDHVAPFVNEHTHPLFENNITVKAGEVRNVADIIYQLHGQTITLTKDYPDSIALYGEKPYRQDFDWLADIADARREIHRRSQARHIARQSFPYIDENKSLAFLNTGEVMNVSRDDEAYRCMLGRRSVQVDSYMTVGWDLVEMPVSDSEDYWILGVSKLGLNTRLAPERFVSNHFLYLGGELLLLGGEPLEIVNAIDYLTLGGEPLTLGGEFLEMVNDD